MLNTDQAARERREQRDMHFTAMETIVETSRSEKRNLTSAERDTFDTHERALKQLDRAIRAGEGYSARGGQVVKRERTRDDEAFTRYLRTGEVRTTLSGLSDTGFQDSGTAGGFTVPPGFWAELTVALKAYGGMSNDFHQLETETGTPMDWAAIDPTAVQASLVTDELTVLDVDSPYVFGQGVLNAWTIAVGPVLASLPFVEDTSVDIDSFIASRFGEALGRKIAAYAVTGTGSGQPLGIYPSLVAKGAVGSGSGGFLGLGTATEVNTINGDTTTEITGNVLSPQTLLNMISSVDPAYRNDADGNATAAFYVNDAQLSGLRTVADTLGRPILQQPNDGGAPMLWGYPVKVTNELTDLTASTVSGPVFMNADHAMVMRTVRNVRVMRLDQRWADALAVGYIGWHRVDIRSNDLRAAIVCKPASS